MQKLEFTYPEVGATARQLPAGYQYLYATCKIGVGQNTFEQSVQKVLHWGIQVGAGLKVSNTTKVKSGNENRLGLFWGPCGTWANCRVVYVVDEPSRKGFAYGTLAGHPESGEESFVVSLKPNGDVVLEIRAFSKSVRWFARLGGPMVRILQQHVTWRYLDAVQPIQIKRNGLKAALYRTYKSPDGLATVRTGGPKNHDQFGESHSFFDWSQLPKSRPQRPK